MGGMWLAPCVVFCLRHEGRGKEGSDQPEAVLAQTAFTRLLGNSSSWPTPVPRSAR